MFYVDYRLITYEIIIILERPNTTPIYIIITVFYFRKEKYLVRTCNFLYILQHCSPLLAVLV